MRKASNTTTPTRDRTSTISASTPDSHEACRHFPLPDFSVPDALTGAVGRVVIRLAAPSRPQAVREPQRQNFQASYMNV